MQLVSQPNSSACLRCQFIQRQLVAEGLLSTKQREAFAFTIQQGEHLQKTIWTRPDLLKSYAQSGRHKVLMTLAYHLFAATGARIGAIFPSKADSHVRGLRYKVGPKQCLILCC